MAWILLLPLPEMPCQPICCAVSHHTKYAIGCLLLRVCLKPHHSPQPVLVPPCSPPIQQMQHPPQHSSGTVLQHAPTHTPRTHIHPSLPIPAPPAPPPPFTRYPLSHSSTPFHPQCHASSPHVSLLLLLLLLPLAAESKKRRAIPRSLTP